MGDSTLRSASEIAGDFIWSWNRVKSELLYNEQDLRKVLQEKPEETDAILNGTDTVSRYISDDCTDYFSDSDDFGQRIQGSKQLTDGSKQYSVKERLDNPSLFDNAISGRTGSDSDDSVNSKFGFFSVGIISSLITTTLLFLALIPITGQFSVDIIGTRIGGLLLLACSIVATFGTEMWHRFISFNRPYVYNSSDSSGDGVEKGVLKFYTACVVGAGLLFLFISMQSPPVTLWKILSGGPTVILARVLLALTVLCGGFSWIFILFPSFSFGIWEAAYPSFGEPDASMASPVDLLLLAPILIILWSVLGGDFYSIAGITPAAIGIAGMAIYPFSGPLVARLLIR